MTKHQFAMWILNSCLEQLKVGTCRVEMRTFEPTGNTYYTIHWKFEERIISFQFEDSDFVRIRAPKIFLETVVRILKRKMYLEKEKTA